MTKLRRSGLRPGSWPPPPAPPLVAPTGIVGIDCAIDVINATAAPFQTAPPPEQGAAGVVAQKLGGVVALVGAPAMMIDAAFAGFTAPIAAMFPAMPAVTLLGTHVGGMHAHLHPPSFVPPNPPTPLPSVGMLVGAGAISVLGGGLPLARAGDVGISVTCGSAAPPFEVYTGSSNVFVGGARAARVLDLTRHCNPASMGPFEIALGAAAVVAGAAGAVATQNVVAAAQAAADAATLALKLLCGKDPGLPPGVGALIGPPVPTVLIGGFPCPPIGSIVVGRIMKQLEAAAKAVKRAAKRVNAKVADGSHPIYLVTGENFDEFCDFVSPGLFQWRRHYTTGRAREDGPLGYGFRHVYQRTLEVQLHRATFTDWDGVALEFPKFGPGRNRVVAHGYVLRRIDRQRYELSTRGQPTMVFAGEPFTEVLPLVGMRSEDRELRFAYDEAGRLVAAEDRSLAGGPASRYQLSYDSRGRITGIVEVMELARQPIPRFAAHYTEAGELAFVRDANDGLWAYDYDHRHRWTRQVDPRGYGYAFRYDQDGRCVYACGDDGLWWCEVEYFPDQRFTRYVEGEGAVWEYHYDSDGIVTKIVAPDGGVRIRERDGEGRILSDTDPGGRTLTFLYDHNGAHSGRVDRFGYVHPPESETPQLGDPFADDLPDTALGRLFSRVVDPAPAWMFGAAALPEEVPAELRSLAAQVFRLHPPGALTRAPPLQTWTDPLGNLVAERDALGRERRRSYDACNNEIAYRDRDGRVHRRETVSWNLLGARIDPLGHAVRYRYDRLEQIVGLTDPLGNESRWVYDQCQRLIEVWRHDRVRDRYEYDAHDRFVAKRTGDGELVFRNLDWHPLVLVRRRELASGGEHRFDYDARGRITEASTEAHEVRLRQAVDGAPLLDLRDGVGLERVRQGRSERVRVLDRFEWSVDVDERGAVTLTAPTGAVTRVEPRDDGLIRRECSSGTVEWLQLDHEGRLEARLTARRGPHGHVGWAVRYGYSGEGDLLHVHDSVRGLTRYEVDAAHRLVGMVTPDGERHEYELDPASNLIRSPSTSRLDLRPGNRPWGTAEALFEHDHRDRLSVRRHRDGPVTRYSYDSFDLLDRVELDPGDGSGPRVWRAAYDAIGRRLWTELAGLRREFFWDGDRLAAELDPAGRLRIYLYAGHHALVPLAFVDYDSVDADPDAGRVYHVFCDGVGMPLHVEDERREIVWWASRVDPWGKITVHPSATVEYNLRWPGHYFDAELGLHYNRYRYYDPALGRYLTQDPIGYRGSEVNLYAYCSNPLVGVDVLGLHDGKGKPGEQGEAQPNRVSGRDEPSTGAGTETKGPGEQATEQHPVGRTIQTGGNTIKKRTADILNKATGMSAHAREWGRALESLKQDEGLPPNHHGKITEHAYYLDQDGSVIGNFGDYL